MTDFAKRVEISDKEAFDECGLSVGGSINTWGDKIRPALVARGFDPSILYIGSMQDRVTRDDKRDVTIFEDKR